MLLQTPDNLVAIVTRRGDVSFQPLHYSDEEIIFTSGRVSLKTILGTTDFQSIMSGIGKLAAALNCLDPATDIIRDIDDSYLASGLIHETTAVKRHEKRDKELHKCDHEIFQHPNQLQGQGSPKDITTHDVV